MEDVKSGKFDENLYSRQVGTYGVEAMGKLVSMRVFLYGLRGLGIEVAKNLILAGPKKIVIHDKTIVQVRDLNSNFYCTEADIGKTTRADACLRQLKDLNEYVSVDVHHGEIDTNLFENFDVIVFTDFHDKDKLIEYNNFCRTRARPIGFIAGASLGLYGYTFVDFGPSFTVNDVNGEDPRSAIISAISKDTVGQVTTHEDKRHGFVDGDTVTFREVKGMTDINGKKFLIKVLSPTAFTIGDTTGFKDYEGNGIAEQVKIPKPVTFKALRESLTVPLGGDLPPLENPDLEKWGRADSLHLILHSLFEFTKIHKSLPRINNEEDATALVQLVEKHNAALKEGMQIEGQLTVETVDAELVKNVARFAQTQISPHCSFWGGIVAQEIVKYTGKFMPIRQWIHYETFECLPEGQVDRTLHNCRYDDQIAIFGKEWQEKVLNSKFFLIGAGALGCEYIKMFACMGLACGPKGKLTITDDDNIEISNLNRQFLFRKKNVGHSKSECAGAIGKIMNHDLKVEALKLRVDPSNDEIFNDEFWDGLTGVANAVDNVKARLFVDGRCVFYSKPLFESGTLGTKCNSQMVIPFKTQSYGDSQDPPEESIPLCTLKNFPYQIEHTIQWARDFFEGTFVEGPNEVNKYLEDPEGYVKNLKKEVNNQSSTLRGRLETVNKFTAEYEKASHENCIRLARVMFQDVFNNQISSLLYSFPKEHKTESGQFFWSGPKRCPVALDYDLNDPTHVEFIFHTASLFAQIFNLKAIPSKEWAAKEATKVEVKAFQPKKIIVNEANNTTVEEKAEPDEIVCQELTSKLVIRKPLEKSAQRLTNFEFEKDDDNNHHIDFISAVANLRARNYVIEEVERYKVKLIAGKIIPAIATTTAMVVGAVSIEIIKFLHDKPVEKMRNCFCNLAIPLWVFSEPLPPIKNKDKDYDPILLGPVKAIPPGFTTWDKIIIQGPQTLEGIMKHLKEKYGIQTSIISCGKLCIYNKYGGGGDTAKRLQMTPDECTKHISSEEYPKHKKFVELEISGETMDGTDCLTPSIKYVRH
jgi:ubiquitin-activating enzyme E1